MPIAVALIVGVFAGVLVWATRRGPEPERTPGPDPIQALAGVVEIIPISYEGAVEDGKIIPGQEVQYRGAQDAVRHARARFEEAEKAIAARNAAAARTVEETLREIEQAVAALRPPAEVRRLADRLRETLKDLQEKRGTGA